MTSLPTSLNRRQKGKWGEMRPGSSLLGSHMYKAMSSFPVSALNKEMLWHRCCNRILFSCEDDRLHPSTITSVKISQYWKEVSNRDILGLHLHAIQKQIYRMTEIKRNTYLWIWGNYDFVRVGAIQTFDVGIDYP